MHPFRPFVQKYNGYVMDKYIRKELERRFQEKKSEKTKGSKGNQKSIKSVVSLALDAYMDENQNTGILQKDKLDDRFAKYATWQIRVFLFAGSDTTASMMVYVYHMLSKHPDWLQRLRKEHDEVFGPDPAKAS